jgi:4-aminobutyrate aminotransferase-like enzyme
MHRPVITHGRNDLLHTVDGGVLIDLFAGYGAAWLGHAHAEVTAAVARQLDRLWLAGGLPTPALAEARAALAPWFGPGLALAGLYSTGMEAAEFALRLARVHTGRAGALGFDGSMHGKSFATAALGWDNGEAATAPQMRRLPFLKTVGEAAALDALRRALADGTVGAVFVEPLLGSSGGLQASPGWYREVAALARAHGALLVCDEILTGFHRTGPAFAFQALGLAPDVVLFGKACGNGFPVSGVMAAERIALEPRMLAGSTFAGNPLAATAVAATLGCLARLNAPARVAAIAHTVRAHLGWLDATKAALRGAGALWVVELPAHVPTEPLVEAIYGDGVCVGWYGRQFRLMPALTIEPAHLARACEVVSRRLREAL